MNTTANPGAQGACEPRFDAVRRVFEEQVASGREVGAAVAVTLDGDPIVDLWGGFADQARTTPWDRDTMVNVYSTTKGVTAICAHRLIDEGRLELDAPVARYWPEFAQAGKAEIPVRWLLSHRCGLPAVREPLPGEALYSWGAMTAALAWCCADAQGRGDAMAALLFAAPPASLTPAGCAQLAVDAGCDRARYERDLPAAQARVDAEMAEARAAGDRALPTMYVGHTRLVGVKTSVDQLAALIATSPR